MGEVVACQDQPDGSRLFDVKVRLRGSEAEQHLFEAVRRQANPEETYLKAGRVSEYLGISGMALSRLSGSIIVELDENLSLEIGLGLKYSRRNLLIAGYCRRVFDQHRPNSAQWEYSTLAVSLIKELKTRFPDLIAGVEKDVNLDRYPLTSLFLVNGHPVDNPADRLEELLLWLQSQLVASLPLTPCDCSTLSAANVQAIEGTVKTFVQRTGEEIVLKEMSGDSLLLPLTAPLSNSARRQSIEGGRWQLGQLVANVRATGPVPFGLMGVIVSLYQDIAEVMFIEPFLAASDLKGRCAEFRGFAVPVWTLLNVSAR
jgi:hypothetical protein